MSNFEEAMHNGYSRADLASDMQEKEKRCQTLGCPTCAYRNRISVSCDYVIEQDTIYEKCPYRKEDNNAT